MRKFISTSLTASVLALAISTSPAMAQSSGTMDHSTMNHDEMMKKSTENKSDDATGMPKQPGQGAFAAIAEIVELLVNDPTTDWSKVNIDTLRNHLVDMNQVTLYAEAKTEVMDGKVVFTITGSGRTLKAIQTMVMAHSKVLDDSTAWEVSAKITENGAVMSVGSSKPAAVKVIAALGFFGVMATGAHHQPHHFGMAKGLMVHSH